MKNKFWRVSKKRKQVSQADIEHLKRSSRYIPPIKQKKVLQPLHWIEERLESMLGWLKSLAFLEILQLVGNLSILFVAVIFIACERQQRNAEVYQAWQIITAAYNQPGSGGRIEALEFLNSKPRRNPWFWLKWNRQSLTGLAAPKAYLYEIQLPEAYLEGANLQEANLWGANLQDANLGEANLQDAELEGANLQDAELGEANLQDASLGGANLQDASLGGANLQGADLWVANLQEAYLEGANLQDADLWVANLQGADLVLANLQEANLYKANLQGADLRGADLQRTDLREAQLKGARYTYRNTKPDDCAVISSNHPCSTIFPKGFNPQAAGMVLVKEYPLGTP